MRGNRHDQQQDCEQRHVTHAANYPMVCATYQKEDTLKPYDVIPDPITTTAINRIFLGKKY